MKADYWKTGHSYIKRRVTELKALAGFEKSGHFFFNAPIGRGYDDGLLTAVHVLQMLDRNPGKTMSDLYADAAQDLGLADHVAALRRRDEIWRRRKGHRPFPEDGGDGVTFTGQAIRDLVTVNGVRVTVADGTGAGARLVQQAGARRRRRKPGLGGPHARDVPRGRCGAARESEVGAYNQTI